MNIEEAYQTVLKVALAGRDHKPMPPVPESCRLPCQRLYEAALRWERDAPGDVVPIKAKTK